MEPEGLTAIQPAMSEIQAIANQVKSELEGKTYHRYSVFVAISYRSQVVNGTNYFIKVYVGYGEEDYVHLRVFKSPRGQVELSDYQLDKTRDDPITYF